MFAPLFFPADICTCGVFKKNLLQFEVKSLCLMLTLEIFVAVFVLQFIKQPYDICTKCIITCSKIVGMDHDAYFLILCPGDIFFSKLEIENGTTDPPWFGTAVQ